MSNHLSSCNYLPFNLPNANTTLLKLHYLLVYKYPKGNYSLFIAFNQCIAYVHRIKVDSLISHCFSNTPVMLLTACMEGFAMPHVCASGIHRFQTSKSDFFSLSRLAFIVTKSSNSQNLLGQAALTYWISIKLLQWFTKKMKVDVLVVGLVADRYEFDNRR